MASVLLFAEIVFTDGIPFPAHTDAFLPWRSDAAPERVEEALSRMNRCSTDKNFSFHPDNQVASEALRNGRLPLWNPYQMAGLPYLSQSLYGVFYPLNLPLFLVGPGKMYAPLGVLHFFLAGLFTYLLLRRFQLSRPAALAGALIYMCSVPMTSRFHYYMTQYPMAWAPLMLLIVHRYHERRSLFLLAGLAVVYALTILAGFQQMAVYMGYITLAFSLFCSARDRFAFRPRAAAAGVILVFLAMMAAKLLGVDLLLAYSFAAILAVIAVFATGNGFLRWMAANLPVAGALLLGLGLTAVQMVPVFATLPHSMRNVIPPETMVNELHLPAGGLLGFLFPLLLDDPMWTHTASQWNLAGTAAFGGSHNMINYVENAVYIGLLPLAFIALIRFRREDRGRLFFFGGLSVLLLLLGMGIAFVIYPVWWLPGFQTGDPRRALYVLALTLSVLAAHGMEGIEARKRLHAFFAFLLLFGVLSGVLGFFSSGAISESLHEYALENAAPDERAFYTDNAGAVIESNALQIKRSLVHTGLAAILGAAALLLFVLRRNGLAWCAVVVALLVDLVPLSLYTNKPQSPEGFLDPHPAITVMHDEEPFRIFRFTEDTRSAPRIPLCSNMTTHFGIEDGEGYVVQPLKRYFSLMNAIQPEPNIADKAPAVWPITRVESLRSPIVDLAGFRFIMATREIPDGLGFTEVYRGDGIFVYRNEEAFPRAFFVEKARFFEDPEEKEDDKKAEEALKTIIEAIASPSNDLRGEVFLEGDPVETAAAEQDGTPPKVTVSYPEPETVRITFDQPAPPGYLVLTDAYFPGWTAEADGQPTEVLPAYHAFRAVAVPKWTSEVVFRYKPKEVKIGIVASLFCLGLLLILLICGFVRIFSRPGSSDESCP
jgi:hypothetical protein